MTKPPLVAGSAALSWPNSAALAAQHHTINAYRPHAEVPAEPSAPTLVLPHLGAWADQLDRAWAANPPDVVHAFGWLGGLAAQLAARRHELPLVQSFHGLAESSIPGERVRLEPLLVRNANWVTGGSSAEVDALARLRRSRAQLSVLSSGVDVDRFAPADPSAADGPVRILQVEPNALPQHGFDKVIRILPILPGVELVLAETDAGDPRHDRERTALNRLATGLGVQDRVRFAGSVAAEELPALVRSADVVVCAARHAPQATTALRAMASGVVVVATAVGALTDTVINGVTGLRLPGQAVRTDRGPEIAARSAISASKHGRGRPGSGDITLHLGSNRPRRARRLPAGDRRPHEVQRDSLGRVARVDYDRRRCDPLRGVPHR